MAFAVLYQEAAPADDAEADADPFVFDEEICILGDVPSFLNDDAGTDAVA
jgi:hypothetical protein